MSRLKSVIGYESETDLMMPTFWIGIYDINNVGVLFLDSDAMEGMPSRLARSGSVICVTEPLRLTPRRYFLNIAIRRGGQSGVVADYIQQATHFDIVPSDPFGMGRLPPPHFLFMADYKWHFQNETL
jgi:lipopolysaccharide transport system ATP-binding protein